MDTAVHNMQTLFQQLGLPDSDQDIEQFIDEHSLAPEQSLQDADFWSKAQAHFLEEAISEDADWAEIVDELDACLHQAKTSPLLQRPQNWLDGTVSDYLPEPIAY